MKPEIIEGIAGKAIKIGSVTLSHGGISTKNSLIQSKSGYRLVNGAFRLIAQTFDAPGVTVYLPKMSEKNKKEAVRQAKEVLGWVKSF